MCDVNMCSTDKQITVMSFNSNLFDAVSVKFRNQIDKIDKKANYQ